MPEEKQERTFIGSSLKKGIQLANKEQEKKKKFSPANDYRNTN